MRFVDICTCRGVNYVFIILLVFYYRLVMKLRRSIPELPVTARPSAGLHALLSLLHVYIVTTNLVINRILRGGNWWWIFQIWVTLLATCVTGMVPYIPWNFRSYSYNKEITSLYGTLNIVVSILTRLLAGRLVFRTPAGSKPDSCSVVKGYFRG